MSLTHGLTEQSASIAHWLTFTIITNLADLHKLQTTSTAHILVLFGSKGIHHTYGSTQVLQGCQTQRRHLPTTSKEAHSNRAVASSQVSGPPMQRNTELSGMHVKTTQPQCLTHCKHLSHEQLLDDQLLQASANERFSTTIATTPCWHGCW